MQRQLDACRIVLVAPSLAANIGSTVRAMTTMGLCDLVVVSPKDPGFRVHPDARARAGRAEARLDTVRSVDTLSEALADCQLAVAVSAEGREFGPPPVFPSRMADQVMAGLSTGQYRRVAFVFGTERTGLSTGQMAQCQHWLVIPADAGYNSLNLSQAVQIVAFSLRQSVLNAGGRQDVAPPGGAGLADLAALEGLYQHLARSLIALGTLDPARPRRLMPRLRRLLGRAGLVQDEVDLLRGICRDIERMSAGVARDDQGSPLSASDRISPRTGSVVDQSGRTQR
ncbi:MAG: TrmH family RNA methyltransferase [Lautropia sp.]|nr:TrmH family RNA methyltransferase [Lautropia sp.]